MKVATHVVFAECCWFATSAVFDVQYAIPEVLAVGAASLIPDADYPESWLGYRLGRVSKDLNRLFGHRSFLHSLLALVLVVTVLGLPMWWIAGNLAPVAAIFVGYGSHLVADAMSVGGVQLFWPNRAIAVFPAATTTASSPARVQSVCSSSWFSYWRSCSTRFRGWASTV